MNKRTLSRSLRNDVFKAISEEGLDAYVSQFEWKEVEARFGEGTESQLCCDRDGLLFYFCFHFSGEHCWPIYFPGKTMNVVSISAALSWDSTLAKVREWASRVRREFEEPDYWKGIADLRSPFPFNANAINNDAPLSAFQATKLREGLSSLHIRLVKEFSLNQAQSDLILGKLDHLSKAIEKQSRTDWVNMAIGVLVTIAMTIGVSSANSDKFWGLVRDSLHTAFQIMIGN